MDQSHTPRNSKISQDFDLLDHISPKNNNYNMVDEGPHKSHRGHNHGFQDRLNL